MLGFLRGLFGRSKRQQPEPAPVSRLQARPPLSRPAPRRATAPASGQDDATDVITRSAATWPLWGGTGRQSDCSPHSRHSHSDHGTYGGHGHSSHHDSGGWSGGSDSGSSSSDGGGSCGGD